MYVDSHCHIHFKGLFEHLPKLIENMLASKVSHALCVNVDLDSFSKLINVVETTSNIFASIGIHPNSQYKSEMDVKKFIALSNHPKIIAIGETGLDYYQYKKNKANSTNIKLQHEFFRQHIYVSYTTMLPLIIHMRSAATDTLNIIREEKNNHITGVMHCFAENWEIAKKVLDLGFYISISGIITFKNTTFLKEVVRYIPQDRLLIETDSPYLAPVPYRGKINEPSYVKYIADYIAKIRGITSQDLGKLTTSNFFRLFKKANF